MVHWSIGGWFVLFSVYKMYQHIYLIFSSALLGYHKQLEQIRISDPLFVKSKLNTTKVSIILLILQCKVILSNSFYLK
jgi:hypothetical protein